MPYKDPDKRAAYTHEYRQRPHEKQKRAARSRQELQEKPARIKKNIAVYNMRLKVEVFTAYGNRCVCCGESNIKFLTLDHVNNDGRLHRKTVKSGRRVYAWAKKNGYPDSLRLLCWNCNCGRHYNNGVCPHEEEMLRLIAS